MLLLYRCNGVICKYRDLPDLGDGYRFETLNCETLEIVNSDNTVFVDGVILDYAFDSTFIVVSQRPWHVPDVLGIKEMKYKEHQKAFENSKFLQYWIINKKEESKYSLDSLLKVAKYSNVYGPFQKDEYLKKREELDVPLELQLKE
jgi:hypothetical protein